MIKDRKYIVYVELANGESAEIVDEAVKGLFYKLKDDGNICRFRILENADLDGYNGGGG